MLPYVTSHFTKENMAWSRSSKILIFQLAPFFSWAYNIIYIFNHIYWENIDLGILEDGSLHCYAICCLKYGCLFRSTCSFLPPPPLGKLPIGSIVLFTCGLPWYFSSLASRAAGPASPWGGRTHCARTRCRWGSIINITYSGFYHWLLKRQN